MKTLSKSVIASAIAALFTVAAFSVQAGNEVKSGGNQDRPARALDADNSVKSQGATDKPGRALDEPKAKGKAKVTAQGESKRHGRAIDDAAVRSAGATDKPGRAIEEGAVRSQGATDKPGRAIEDGAVMTNKHKKAKAQPRAIEGNTVKQKGGESDKSSRALQQKK